MASQSVATNSHTITGLLPGAKYNIKVRVDSPVTGPFSAVVQGTVSEGVTYGADSNITYAAQSVVYGD
jgi:hypothetical protein